MPLILASKSIRRAELLKSLGLEFDIVAPDIDESALPGELAPDHVRRLAVQKALAVAEKSGTDDAVILAADTVVVCQGRILGKPADENDARAMLLSLSGRQHQVLTGFAVLTLPEGEMESGVETTQVHFKTLSSEEIEAYVASGEPMDKAGAYAIQGKAGDFVTAISGSFTNVIGLPIERIKLILAKRLRNPSLSS